MNDKIFIDTNIWVYLYSNDEVKSNKSEELINEYFNRALLSTQVLNELINVLAVKLRIKTKEETNN